MTPSTKPVTRLSSAFVRDRGFKQVVVTVLGDMIHVRTKGARTTYSMPISAVYGWAVRAHLAAVKAEKLKARKTKRGAR